MTSPCSVSLSRPSTEPGRAAEDRSVRRPAAAPDGAAATVEQRQLDVVRARRPRRARAWARWSIQCGGEEPRLLVRVGVAEHHLLAIAPRREVRAVAGSRSSASRIAPARPARRTTRTAGRRRGPALGRRPPPRRASCQDVRARRRGAAVNETTTRRTASGRTAPGPPPIERNVASTSPRSTPGATSVARSRRQFRAPPALRDGPRCAAGSRATPGGTRTSRPASAAPRPLPRRPARDRRRRGRPGSWRSSRSSARLRIGPDRGPDSPSRRARATQSLGDEPEPLPVWLIGEATPQLSVRFGELLRIPREPCCERLRDALVWRRDRTPSA